MLKNRVKLTISLPPETIGYVKTEAEKNYMPVGRFIEKLIDEYKKSGSE